MRNMRYRPLWITITICVLGLSSIGEAQGESANLGKLIESALEFYPELKAKDAAIRAETSRFDQVTSFPDPMVMVSYSNFPVDTWQASDSPMTGIQVLWTQNIPWLPKLRARGEVVRAMAEVLESRQKVTRLQVRQGVQEAWYELYFVERALEVLSRSEGVLVSLDELTQARYAVGKGLQSDLLQVQVERTRLETQRTELQERQAMVIAQLRRWLPQSVDLNLALPEQLPLSDLNISLTDALTALAQSNPQLDIQRCRQAVAQRQQDVARQSFFPDFQLQGGYRYRDNGLMGEMNDVDLATIGVGMSVPLYQSPKRAALAQAKYEEMEARFSEETAWEVLSSQVEAALTRLRRAKRLLVLYQFSLVPQAEQSFHAVQAAYQVGNVEFQTLLQAEMLLLRLETEQHRLEADHQQAVAMIEMLVGQTDEELRAQYQRAVQEQPDSLEVPEDEDVINESLQ